MPLRFNSAPAPDFYDVIQFKLDVSWHLVVGSDRALRLESPMHWLSAQSRLVPCLHEDCPWCHLPTRHVCYCPAQHWVSSAQMWRNVILPVSDGMRDFLKEETAKKIYLFVRRGRSNAPVSWRQVELNKIAAPFTGFDCLPSLRRMWGEYCAYKKRGPALFDESGDELAAG